MTNRHKIWPFLLCEMLQHQLCEFGSSALVENCRGCPRPEGLVRKSRPPDTGSHCNYIATNPGESNGDLAGGRRRVAG